MDTRSTQPDKFGWDDERISAYLDGELTASEQAQFEKDLSQNSELNQLVEDLRIVRQQLEQLPQHKLESDVTANVLIRAAHEILANSQLRSEHLHNESNNNGVASNLDHKSISPNTAVTPTSASKDSSHNLRPLIWSVVALAAGLMLLITNFENPVMRDESVADNWSKGGRSLFEGEHAPRELSGVMRETGGHEDPKSKLTYDYSKKDFGSQSGREDFIASRERAPASIKSHTAPLMKGGSSVSPSPAVAKAPFGATESRHLADKSLHGATIAKTDAMSLPRFADSPATSPTSPSEPLGKFAKSSGIPSDYSGGLGDKRDDFDNFGSNRNTIVHPEPQSTEEMFVVQMTCEPETIKNRAFDKLLRENKIAIVDEVDARRGLDNKAKAEIESANNLFRNGGNAGPPTNAPDKIKNEGLVNKGFNSKSSDSDAFNDIKSSDDKSNRVSDLALNSKDVEVVMIEMDRVQFDKLVSEVCNKTDEYANVQIAQAPLQPRFDALNNYVDTYRYNSPTQPIATPFELNVSPNNSALADSLGQNPMSNTRLNSNAMPATSGGTQSTTDSVAGSISGPVGPAVPVTPLLTPNGTTQNGVVQNIAPGPGVPSTNFYSNPASGGIGGSASNKTFSLGAPVVSNQSSSQSLSSMQQNHAWHMQNYSNTQLNQLGAAQRLEFAEIDNRNVKDATRNRYAINSTVADLNQGIPNNASQLKQQYAGKSDAFLEANRVPSNKPHEKFENSIADASGTNPNSQQVQPLMKASAPPASMSQSAVPKLDIAPNEATPPSQAPALSKIAIAKGNVSQESKIATDEEEKEVVSESGLTEANKSADQQDIAGNDNEYQRNKERAEPINGPVQQKEVDLRAKLNKKIEGVAANGKSSDQGQAARGAGLSKSAEQSNQQSPLFDQRAQQFNQTQGMLAKPSSNNYTPNQQQSANQGSSQASTEQGQFFAFNQQQNFAFQPQQQQQLSINAHANGRVRAVFILQKKPTQEVNPEPARSLSK